MTPSPSSVVSRKDGFTLVELSIVIVIIGLIVGGVMVGQGMIRASELRSVVTQEQRFVTAVQNFNAKYQALPGDMLDATSIWGTATTCPGDYTTPSTDARTCNGDGNGLVYFAGVSSNPTMNEVYRFWQQLANAGLIEGSYPGVSGTSYFWTTTATNAPTGKIATSSWSVVGINISGGGFSATVPAVNMGNTFLFGGRSAASWNSGPVLTPPEAYGIDLKVDDGMPHTGKVLGQVSSGCTGTGDQTLATATYVLTGSTPACFIMFANAF